MACVLVRSWTSCVILSLLVALVSSQPAPECGGQLTTSYGVFMSPGYPSNYPLNARCYWTIVAPANNVIDLRFKTFDMFGDSFCSDVVSIYDGESENAAQLMNLCGKLNQTELSTVRPRSSGNKMYISFQSSNIGSRQGFIASYRTQVCTAYSYGAEECNQSCNCVKENSLGCDSTTGNCMCKLGWTSRDCSIARCKNESCTYNCRVTETNPWTEQCYCPDWLNPVITNKGVSCLERYACGSIISPTIGLNGYLSSPGYPNGYSKNINCSWRIVGNVGQIIAFRFTDFQLQNSYNCASDYVEVFDELSAGTAGLSLGRFCGGTTPRSLQTTSNSLRVLFKSSSFGEGIGFNATFNTQAKACTTLTLASGILTSPSFPNVYQDNTFLCWLIVGTGITMSFQNFDLESQATCNYDALEVYNGNNNASPLLGKYCGNTLPPTLRTSGNMYIAFKTDSSVVRPGFKASYTSTTLACGGTFYSTSGTITSPGYPRNYLDNTLCYWTIIGSANQIVSFRISDLSLETNPSCIYDYVDVYDGANTNSPRIGHYCQGIMPITVRSTGNVMYIVFRTDFSVTSRGFTADYISTQCFPWFFGHGCQSACTCIRSNTNYCNSLTGQCVCNNGWTGTDCSQRYDPCMSNPCSSNAVCHSQNLSFSCLSPVSSCTANLNAQSGYITSPQYPRNYLDYGSCTWTITGPDNTVVSLSFLTFDLETTSTCAYDDVTVYDGLSSTSRVIGKYCGSRVSGLLRSTSNTMRVTFKSDLSVTKKGFLASYTTHSCPSFKFGLTCSAACTCVQTNTIFCDNTNGLCVCKPGWTGANCSEDVNECLSPGVSSKCPLNSICQNTPGNYTCICRPGFIFNWLGKCEASSNCAGFGLCSHSCFINTAGKKECTCPDNMILSGDRFTCIVPFYPNGPNARDSIQTREDKVLSNGAYYSKVFLGVAGVPFGNRLQKEAYILSNGIISFESPAVSQEPNLISASASNKNMIAPFWAKINTNKGTLYYHWYEKCDTNDNSPMKSQVFERAAKDVKEYFQLLDFNVNTALVATWIDVHPAIFTGLPPRSFCSCFRPVLILGITSITSYICWLLQETAYVIFIYQSPSDQSLRWVSVPGRRVQAGFVRAGINIMDIGSKADDFVYQLSDEMGDNTGSLKGAWAYEVGRLTASAKKCQRYVCQQSALLANPKYISDMDELYKCPCTLDRLGRQWEIFSVSGDITCYIIKSIAKQRLLKNNLRNRICCYRGVISYYASWAQYLESLRWATFIHNSPDAGHVLISDPWQAWWNTGLSTNQQAANENIQAHNLCCKQSTEQLCASFYNVFPDTACSNLVPFITGAALGDPHFTTLDNCSFSMNGWGEYILMDVPSINFTLQARTDRAETSYGTLSNATVFSAFAAKEGSDSSFQVKLSTNKTVMIIMANDSDVTSSFYSSTNFSLYTDNIEIRREDLMNKTQVVAIFSCGVSIIIGLGIKSLEIDLEVDKSLKTLTKGLFGNFNGNPDDDFQLPNGTILSRNLTEREILEQFASAYKVNSLNSVFLYEPGKSTADYQHPEYLPAFKENFNITKFTEATSFCGIGKDACIYDYITTGDQNMALNTKVSKEIVEIVRANLANTPPSLEIVNKENITNNRWFVLENQPNKLQLLASDLDGDNVTYVGFNNTRGITLYPNGTIVYLPNITYPVIISIQVKDTKNALSPALNIPITVRPLCSGHGLYNSTEFRQIEYLEGQFKILKCLCYPAYTGDNCELELNACESQPCSKGQNCTDLTALEQGNKTVGYTCGPCPSGYVEIAKKCIDINECKNSSVCSQICVNTEGSYQCKCQDGFILSAVDKKSCIGMACSNCSRCNCVSNNTESCNEITGQCICKTGWTSNNCSVNINDCVNNTCPAHLQCKDKVAGYDCVCENGQLPGVNGMCKDCNRTLTTTRGNFISSNYPQNYDSNTYCTWTIVSHEPNAIIVLNISEYEVEGCPLDYLEIYDGNSTSARRISRLCDSGPRMVTSTGGSMHVVFISDDSTTRIGFNASYSIETQCQIKNCSHTCQVMSTNPRVEQCECPEWMRLDSVNGSRCLEINACNTTVNSNSGYIVSPGYPKNYPINTKCYWNITGGINSYITFSFSDFDVERSSNCSYDYIKFYDGNSPRASSLGQLCGNVIPGIISSTSGNLYVVFVSDESNSSKGFKGQFYTTYRFLTR
ncbi:unnamed protein product [Lymnaea stagnalis]|uniref:Cubilin n=1 Tax=Lymnaea stagnalis TaxID=6523 RepID=A0AAV2H7Q6_LYMST